MKTAISERIERVRTAVLTHTNATLDIPQTDICEEDIIDLLFDIHYLCKAKGFDTVEIFFKMRGAQIMKNAINTIIPVLLVAVSIALMYQTRKNQILSEKCKELEKSRSSLVDPIDSKTNQPLSTLHSVMLYPVIPQIETNSISRIPTVVAYDENGKIYILNNSNSQWVPFPSKYQPK